MKAGLAGMGVAVAGRGLRADRQPGLLGHHRQGRQVGRRRHVRGDDRCDTITLLKQAGQVNLPSKIRIFGTGFLDDDAAMAVGPDVVGVNTVARYHFSFDTPQNKRFVEAYRKKYNEWPNAYAGHAFDGINWFLDEVEKTGSWDAEKWVTAFEASSLPELALRPEADARLRSPGHRRRPLGGGGQGRGAAAGR